MACTKHISVLFVCTGNICRSPMAEAIFKRMVEEAGLAECFKIASAATTTWEIGNRPHPGTRDVLRANNIALDPDKRAQQITRQDALHYDYILVMDTENVEEMRYLGATRFNRLLEFAPHLGVLDVPDPYYTQNFNYTYQLITAGCRGLLEHIRQKEGM